MLVKLIRHYHPDYPDWQIVDDDVELGTQYLVLDIYTHVQMTDIFDGRVTHLDCYLVEGNDGRGLLPICVLEPVVMH